ncbi:hypothetical protein [Roseimicrobium sp. ORNL1]|uniref:hypothetical protein n=1 Tax=Roseimicrobium sp. ORNL1 TaxID=2711231 RepID=UPI0013E19A6F|nr:hypothetical protein [Roseimicrobium sp. ORNL1]QIF01978.1 hypothetical protein G5S37_10695 [Roseimicrobium sp. ORNL1]
MSRRAKLLLTGIFLLLLAIPATYVALTWRVADPLRFRYVGIGEVHMVDNPFAPDAGAPKQRWVWIFIEVQNTTKLPIYFMGGQLRAERDRASPKPSASIIWEAEPIPRHGTIRLGALVEDEAVQRLGHEAFEISYESLSGTQMKACELVLWVEGWLHKHFHIDRISDFNMNRTKSVTGLIIDPTQLPEPSSSKTTSSP